MKPLPFFFCLLLPLLVTGTADAGGPGGMAISTSQPVSSIRGLVLDADTRIPLTGVSVVIDGSNPLIGTVSDENGAFHFHRLPVGRYDLNIY